MFTKRFLLGALTALMVFPMFAYKTVTLQGVQFRVDTLRHVKVGPGTNYTAYRYKSLTTSKQFNAYFLHIDVKNNDRLHMKMEIANDSNLTTERPSSMAIRKSNSNTHYIAGTNADFFITAAYVPEYVGMSHMDCVLDGEMATCGYLAAKDYGHFFMDYDNNMWCDNPQQSYTVTLPNGTTEQLARINQDIYANELMLFNSKNGKYTHVKGCSQAVLRLAEGEKWAINKPIRLIVDKIQNDGNMAAIPANGAVLCGNGTKAPIVDGLKVGDEITYQINLALPEFGGITPNIKEATGGDVVILKRGQVVYEAHRWIDSRDANNPRVMIGYNEDRSNIILGVVDGRSSISTGCTYPEGAEIMLAEGCWDALNGDGGGSATMYLQNFGVVNKPSDGSERPVANGLFAVVEAPEDNTIAEIRFVDWAMNMPQYGIYTPKFYGYNQYGILIDTDVKGVTISCPAGAAEIQNAGTALYANTTGAFVLTAVKDGLTATIPVSVTTGSDMDTRLKNVIVDFDKPYNIELQSVVNGEIMPLSPQALTWSSEDTNVATFEGEPGVVYAGYNDGTTAVNGTLGATKCTINVTTQHATMTMPIEKEFDASTWTVAQTGAADLKLVPEYDGFKITYKGASGRSPYIKLTKSVTLWSLPDEIYCTLASGDAPVKNITLSLTSAQGVVVNKQMTGTINQYSALNFNLAEHFGDDRANYPYVLNSITINLGTQTKDKEYTLSFPAFNCLYKYAPGSVEGIAIDSKKDNVIYDTQNDLVKVSSSDEICVYTAAGVLLKKAKGSILSLYDLPNGAYIVTTKSHGSVKAFKK